MKKNKSKKLWKQKTINFPQKLLCLEKVKIEIEVYSLDHT